MTAESDLPGTASYDELRRENHRLLGVIECSQVSIRDQARDITELHRRIQAVTVCADANVFCECPCHAQHKQEKALVEFVLRMVGADTENPYACDSRWAGTWVVNVPPRTEGHRAWVEAMAREHDRNLAAALVEAFNAGSETPLTPVVP